MKRQQKKHQQQLVNKILKVQMQGKDFVDKTEQVFTRSLENKLVNEAMNKVKLREDKR